MDPRGGQTVRATRRLRAVGMGWPASGQVHEVLDRTLGRDLGQLAMVRVEWGTYVQALFGGATPAMLGPLAAEIGVAASGAADLIVRLKAAPPHKRSALLLAHIQAVLAELLTVEVGSPVDPDRGIFELGLDSLMVLALKNRLQASLGRPLPATIAFNYPTPRRLASYLIQEALGIEGPDAAPPPEEPQDALDAMLAELEGLSEEEAEALLDEGV